MSAAVLIANLAGQGICLSIHGDKLRVEVPPDLLTDDLRALLTSRKLELLAILAPRKTAAKAATAGRLREVAATWPTDLRERWEERAAIMEYDGNAPRELAEDCAFHELLPSVLAQQIAEQLAQLIPYKTPDGRRGWVNPRHRWELENMGLL